MFDFNDNRLELVTEYKYIGLSVTYNGKLKYAAELLAQRARKAFFGLKANIPSSDSLSVQKWLKLYNSMITPILTYGSEIWIADHKINMENLHNLSFEKNHKIRVITKLPNSEQSYKGKVKTHNYINRQNQSTTGKL